jgi:electron transfer flavoprotein alpha subunit
MVTAAADKGVWVLAEYSEGELADVSIELASEGKRLADKLRQELVAVLIGTGIPPGLAGKFRDSGINRLMLVDGPGLEETVELRVQALSEMVREAKPGILLCSTTIFGREMAARLAAALKTGLAPNCLSLDFADDGRLQCTLPAHTNKTSAKMVFPTARPQIITAAPGAFDVKRARGARQPVTVNVAPKTDPSAPCARTLRIEKGDPRTMSVEEAPIIVSGGKGVGSKANFALLDRLAEALGGVTAGSRIAVDLGFVPVAKQVGQTGKTVTPRLYLACGISGSNYHTIGMKESKVIIVINNDKSATIFKMADLGLVGDLLEIVPAITAELAKNLEAQARTAPEPARPAGARA